MLPLLTNPLLDGRWSRERFASGLIESLNNYHTTTAFSVRRFYQDAGANPLLLLPSSLLFKHRFFGSWGFNIKNMSPDITFYEGICKNAEFLEGRG